jgi:hypothetical protein
MMPFERLPRQYAICAGQRIAYAVAAAWPRRSRTSRFIALSGGRYAVLREGLGPLAAWLANTLYGGHRGAASGAALPSARTATQE